MYSENSKVLSNCIPALDCVDLLHCCTIFFVSHTCSLVRGWLPVSVECQRSYREHWESRGDRADRTHADRHTGLSHLSPWEEGGREGGRERREREGENFNHVMVNETFYLVNLSKQVVRLAKIFSLAKISSYTVCIMYTCMYMYACMCVHVHVHAHVPLAFHPDWW